MKPFTDEELWDIAFLVTTLTDKNHEQVHGKAMNIAKQIEKYLLTREKDDEGI